MNAFNTLKKTPFFVWSFALLFVFFVYISSAGVKPKVSASGSLVDGLKAVVSFPKSAYKAGELISPLYQIQNTTKTNITIWQCGFYPNHRLELKNAQGREVTMTARGKEATALFAPAGPRRKNLPVILAPGESVAVDGPEDLLALFSLENPGSFYFRIIYQEVSDTWSGRLDSNWAVFQILPP